MNSLDLDAERDKNSAMYFNRLQPALVEAAKNRGIETKDNVQSSGVPQASTTLQSNQNATPETAATLTNGIDPKTLKAAMDLMSLARQ